MSTWSSRTQKPARRRSITILSPKLTKASGAWGALTAVIGLLAVTVQTTGLIVTALIALTGTIVTAIAGDRVAVQTRRASTEQKRSPGRKPRARRGAAVAGTKPRKRPKCSARCQKSTQDPRTCDCSCGGKTHGVARAGGAKVTREQLKAKPARKQERQVVRTQRKAT